MGGRYKRAGIFIYMRLIHTVVQQKLVKKIVKQLYSKLRIKTLSGRNYRRVQK